jgi:hypothetical protein
LPPSDARAGRLSRGGLFGGQGWCRGLNRVGKPGDGTTTDRLTAVPVVD